MKILYIGIFWNGLTPNSTLDDKRPDAVQLCSAQDLSIFNRFYVDKIDQVMMFYVQTIAGRTKPGQRQELEERSYKFHSFSRTNGVAGVFVTDAEYPLLVAHQCLSKIVDEFLANYPSASANPFPTANSCPFSSSLERYIKIYDNPENADSIIKIQQELDKTQIIMHKTIEAVLWRDEKLDNLLEKSKWLNGESKKFYKETKPLNNCCLVM